MKNTLHEGMAEARRLIRSGDLLEATAAIQNNLRAAAGRASGGPVSETTQAAPLESVFRRANSGWSSQNERPTNRPSPPAPDGAGNAGNHGQFMARSYRNNAGTRSYKLYVPSAYRGQPLPLMVMLHGCTQSPDDFAAGTRMNTLAEERGFLVVYPAQALTANRSMCWNWFHTAEQQRDQGEPSLIAGITRDVISEYSIDHDRVHVAGLSAGGAMAAILGAAYPDLYAAVGVHSGLPPGAAHDLPSALAVMRSGGVGGAPREVCNRAVADPDGRNVPTIIFHGDRDTTVHPRNGEQIVAQWSAIHAASARSDQSGTDQDPIVEQGRAPDGRAYTRRIFCGTREQPCLEHWRLHGAGHAWSGGSPAGTYTDPRGPDATREMIRFFGQNPKRATQGRSNSRSRCKPADARHVR